jgi:hypothetical protein
MGEQYFVVLFYSTSIAIRAESVAKKAGYDVKLIPTPRHLSSDCGTALRIKPEDNDAIAKLLEDESVDYDLITEL